MARILICHVPKDASPARDLGAALMGRGHFVSFDGEPDAPRSERASRLRQFEAVIVLWTETSAQNAGLSDIARATLPLNLLVPVRGQDLTMTRLPLAFRKLNMLTPRDTDGIARVVARMSTAASSLRDMAEREAARRSGAGAVPEAPATSAAPGTSAAPAVRPAASAPAPDRRRSNSAGAVMRAADPGPVRQSDRQSSPIAEPGEHTRVRPLLDLPEVDAGPRDAVLAPAHAQTADQTAHDLRPASQRARHAPEPPRPSVQPLTADSVARAIDAGLLVHHIPAGMWLGAPMTVEIALDREVLAGIAQSQPGWGALGQSLETLSVSLYGSSEAFEIERQSERTQFVSAKHALAARDPATFGRWAWIVTPGAAGPQDLVVRISALLRDPRGVPAPLAIPDRRFSIDIQVPEGETLASAFAGWYRG